MKADSEIRIRGIIAPMDWDDDYNVTAIKISTDNEEDIGIETDPVGNELFKYIREPVVVYGILSEDTEGNKTVSVKNFKIIE